MNFSATDTISRIDAPLDWTPEKDRVFLDACRELACFHYENSSVIRYLYDRQGFSPSTLRSVTDLEKLPSVGVTAMKYHLLTSRPHEACVLHLTSSGTRGQKTQIWFDEDSLARVQSMLTVLWTQLGLVSDAPTNYLMMIYDPNDAKDLGIAFSVTNQQRFAPVAASFYAIKKNTQDQWEFKARETLQTLKDYARAGHSVRICGVPSFIFDLFEFIDEPLQLPPGSFVLTGGGWKSAEERSIPKAEFRQRLAERLGIPESHIRDGYGMAEHSAPYVECARHRFHVPVFNRILVRDPATMAVLPAGETGLLELITPFNTMMPNLSVLSTDLGYIDPTPCPCGHTSPTFTLVGRGGLAKHKGCAITAAEITKRVK